MKRFVAIFLIMVVAIMLLLLAFGCASQRRSKCPTYSDNYYHYEYQDLNTDIIKMEREPNYRYSVGDTVERFPEGTKFVIVSVAHNGLKLTCPKL
jgi:hypothetical protein